MLQELSKLLSPGNGTIDREVVRSLLHEFAAIPIYRSAAVEELVLNGDYFRRPLRPEDLRFIDFSTPLDSTSASSLSALATHRMLLCIHDAQTIRPPGPAQGWSGFLEFYSDRNLAIGAIIRPFLEDHAFRVLEERVTSQRAGLGQLMEAVLEVQADRLAAEAHISELAGTSSAREARRMQLVQFFGLAPERRRALRAIASGWLSEIPEAGKTARVLVESVPGIKEDAVADELGGTTRSHAYWQFYLPAGMAVVNLLHYLASRGRNALRSIGALIFGVIAENAFIGQSAQQFVDGRTTILASEQISRLVRSLVEPVAEIWGESVWTEVSAGLRLCARAQEIADEDLLRQLTWLSGIERYRQAAETIQAKIDTERISIDRETFEEPREMCSTTHVHDDFRLVVIESGEMVFWGAPGMRLTLAPGEMVLVPKHRLHGSSVLSDVCVYHQPIIPEAWINEYLGSVSAAAAHR